MIYLDNSATTRPCEKAILAMEKAMKEAWGNPSSLHRAGNDAALLLMQARNEIILSLFGQRAKPLLPNRPNMPGRGGTGRLIFTSSGTESDNLAIIGAVRSSKVKNPRIIATDSEHPAVLSTLAYLESEGADIIRLSTKNGVIDENEFVSSLTTNTVLITMMYVNNETGAIYDIPKLFAFAKSRLPNVICHTDCVQAYLKTELSPSYLKADMITVSAHKVHGPKGVGALWISDEIIKKKRISAIIQGGEQEYGLRSGTENLPCISAFAEAVKYLGSDKAYVEFIAKASALREILKKNLPKGAKINTPSGKFSPHIISITLPIPKSQPMLNFLSGEGVYISSGSACSSHKDTVSHVLTSFGLTHDEADRTVRVSLCLENTEEEILTLCRLLEEGIRKLA